MPREEIGILRQMGGIPEEPIAATVWWMRMYLALNGLVILSVTRQSVGCVDR